jgi:hypothetical protein
LERIITVQLKGALMVIRKTVNIYPYDGNHIILTNDLVNDKAYPFKHVNKNGRRDRSEDLIARIEGERIIIERPARKRPNKS